MTVQCPMPGKVISVEVSVGQSVKAGDPVIILEAMKMEMDIPAPEDGVIRAIHVKAGDAPQAGDIIAEL